MAARKPRAPKLVVVDHAEDARSPYCCGSAYKRIRALGAGWRWLLVHGIGTIEGTAPKPAPPSGPGVWNLWAGLRGELDGDPDRSTIDVEIPVHSISLRLVHDATGFRAVACWTWRSDKEAWGSPSFYAWHPRRGSRRPATISAAAFASYVGRDLAAPAERVAA